MYTEPDKSAFFSDLKNLLVDYVQTRLELTRLNAFEKIAKIVAYLVIGIVLALLFFFGLLFLSLMLAYYLSDVLESQLAGFGIVAGIYFLAFVLILRSGNTWISKRIIDGIIRILYERQQEENDDDDEQ